MATSPPPLPPLRTIPPFLGPPFLNPGTSDSAQSSATDSPTETAFSTPLLTPPPVSDPGSISSPPATSPGFTLSFTPTDSDTGSLTLSSIPPSPTSSDSNTFSTPTDSLPPTTSSGAPQSPSSSPPMSVAPTPSPSSSPSPSPVLPVPVSAAATSHHHHAGAIAGGVIGGLALLVAIIGVLLFARSRYSAIRRRRRRSAAVVTNFRKWDGLSSRDSGIGLPIPASNPASAYKNTGAPTRHSSTGSTAVMLSGPTSSVGHGQAGDYYASDGEKSPAGTAPSSAHGHDLVENAVGLPYNSYPYEPATPTSAAFPPGRPRERSTSQNRALALAALDSGHTRSPSSPYAHGYNRQSLDGRVLSSPPVSPSALHSEAIRMNRTSSGARRAARKAVPKYDESEFADDRQHPPSPEQSHPPVALPPPQHPEPQDLEAARDSVYYDSRATPSIPSASSSSTNLHAGSSTVHGSTQAASLTTARSREDLVAAGYQLPRLSEKTSFGDMRTVHYLMPDLPPPQRS